MTLLDRLAQAVESNSPGSAGYHALEMTESGTAPAQEDKPARSSPPGWQRHRTRLLLGLLATVGVLAWAAKRDSIAGLSSDLLHSYHDALAGPLPPSRFKVGPRSFAPFYHGRGCNAEQFLTSFKAAVLRPDGRSKSKFDFVGEDENELPPLDKFEFSYDMPGCPQPHFFTGREACDLLNAFGGIYLRGDSLMRQFAQGPFMLLRNSFQLVRESADICSGNALFTNSVPCKFVAYFDSREFGDHNVCDEEPFFKYEQAWDFAGELNMPEGYEDYEPVLEPKSDGGERLPPVAQAVRLNEARFVKFTRELPARRQRFSPIMVPGTGVHDSYNFTRVAAYHIAPFNSYALTLPEERPQPLKLFSMALAPGALKPTWALPFQGPESVLSFNAAMKEELAKANAELGETDPSRGAWGAFDWYNITDGADSYDGTHYSFQIAMERAQTLLNVLDIMWGDIVAAGGLLED